MAGTGLDDVDSYIVSSDLLLQSTPQSWTRDPSAYLDGIADAEVRRIVEVLDSPVAVQPIDTEAVRSAFDGEPFVGKTRNAVGRRTVQLVDADRRPRRELGRRHGDPARRSPASPCSTTSRGWPSSLAVLLPLAALAGFLLARRLTKPIPVAVEAARAVAGGERHLDLPSLGNDEFGDLGRRLTRMAGTLERQEQALADEFERRRDLLLSVLPPISCVTTASSRGPENASKSPR